MIRTPGFVVLFLVALLLAIPASFAQRPSASELLPENTVVFVQVPDIQRLVRNFKQTGFGRMLQDERVAPFVEQVYADAIKAYGQVEEQVGVAFEDLTSLPTGEICFAIVTPRRADPAFVLILDVNQETEAASKLIDRGRQLAENDGATFETQQEGELELQVIRGGDVDVTYLVHEGTFIASTSTDVLKEMLVRWEGQAPEDDRTFADNRKFITIMNRCRSTREAPSELAFFVDPIELFRGATRGNLGARAAMGFLPILGLDGLLAIGGASIFDEQGYESIFHLHVYLANPRAGIFEMLAMKPGDNTPEPWVPADVGTYVSSHWDVDKMFAEFEKMFNAFSGEGKLQEEIEANINSELELDFRQDIIGALQGRVTYVTWMEPPARINSQVNAVGIELNSPGDFRDVLEKIRQRVIEQEGGDNLVVSEHRGVEIWSGPENRGRERFERLQEEDNVRVNIRFPDPCMAIIGNWMVVSESREFVKHAIETYKGDRNSLSEDKGFQAVMDHTTRLLGTRVPGMVMYNRPEESFRMFFELAKAENTHEALAVGAEEVEFLADLKRNLEQNPLPDFEDMKQYFAPSGALLTNDETGFHLLTFQLKGENAGK